ncbi:glucokinase [Sphingomonas gilva]|uniref:Glucokinase n=1 Tax=Sphingomonas gilva TaxID=2305907 RepID=A0A396S3A5_9SPHN|nr:glucokinase [Sphingomonas gilva]RHW17865.1 glucokinase [Sphingomonas gilva]
MGGDALGLVADVGRVSVRFGLTGGGKGLAPRNVRSFHTGEHSTFTSALVAYLAELRLEDTPLPSALAIAGAVNGDVINLTGSRWYISLSGVEAVLRTRPRALNECAAKALALTALPQSAISPLPGPASKPVAEGGNYLVVSMGTGLGVAALISESGRFVPVASEAGHMAFSPRSADEEALAQAIAAKGQSVSAESLLSAGGLVAAYAALGAGKTVDKAEEVTRRNAGDETASRTTAMFVEYLGAYVGDLALAFTAWQGVYLTGPIARALQAQLAAPAFRRRLEDKGVFRRQLASVPVSVVSSSDLELIGAAAALNRR